MISFAVSDVPILGGALPAESLESSLRRRTNAPIETGACNAANLVRDQFYAKRGGDGLHALVAAAHLAFDQGRFGGGGPRHNEFPSGLSGVGFTWQYFTSEIAMEFLGGFVGVSQDPATLALRPAVGWAVREAR